MTILPEDLYDPAVLQTAFNRAAGTYDAAAVLSKEVADRLIERLDYMRIQPATILDIGAGTGYVSQLLAKRYPTAQIYAVDFAENMLKNGEKNLTFPNLHWLAADAYQLPFPPAHFDLILSNLMLPWCMQLPILFSEMQRVLKSPGLFLFSTLGPDTLQELRSSWAAVDDYAHVHLFLDLHDVGDALLQARFVDPVMDREILTLVYNKVHDLLRDLKNTGGQNLLSERRKTWTGKYRFAQFLQHYPVNNQGQCSATFEIIYGHAFCENKDNLNNKVNEFRIPVSSLVRRN